MVVSPGIGSILNKTHTPRQTICPLSSVSSHLLSHRWLPSEPKPGTKLQQNLNMKGSYHHSIKLLWQVHFIRLEKKFEWARKLQSFVTPPFRKKWHLVHQMEIFSILYIWRYLLFEPPELLSSARSDRLSAPNLTVSD